jgi:hypothetical protein
VEDARLLHLSPTFQPSALAYAERPDRIVICSAWYDRESTGYMTWDTTAFVGHRGPSPTLTSPDFGCCGPSGDVFCTCGACLGSIEADCSELGFVELARIAIELSRDADDAWWELYAYADGSGWHREEGTLVRGRREGTWSSYRHPGELEWIREYREGVVVAST